jgi:hypothetical protein
VKETAGKAMGDKKTEAEGKAEGAECSRRRQGCGTGDGEGIERRATPAGAPLRAASLPGSIAVRPSACL